MQISAITINRSYFVIIPIVLVMGSIPVVLFANTEAPTVSNHIHHHHGKRMERVVGEWNPLVPISNTSAVEFNFKLPLSPYFIQNVTIKSERSNHDMVFRSVCQLMKIVKNCEMKNVCKAFTFEEVDNLKILLTKVSQC